MAVSVPAMVPKLDYPVRNSQELFLSELQDLRENLTNLIEMGQDKVAGTLIEANYHTLREQLDAGLEGIEQAALLDVLAQTCLNMGNALGASRLLMELSHVLEKQSHTQPLTNEILEHMGAMYTALERPHEAIKLYERSLTTIQQEMLVSGDNSLSLVNAMLTCASALRRAGSLARSIEIYRKLVCILDGSDSQDLVLSLSNLGFALLEDGNHTDAEIALSRALQVIEKSTARGQHGVVLSALAQAKYMAGENEVAVNLYRHAFKSIETQHDFPGQDEIMEGLRVELSTLLMVMGRHEEAQNLLEDNVHAMQSKRGPSSLQLLVHLKNLAVSYANSGNLVKCECQMRRCLQIVTSHFGPNAPQLVGILEMLATCLHHLDKLTEAEAFARQCLLLCEAHYSKDHPFTGDACNCLAAVLFSLEKYEEASKLMSRVLKIQEKELGLNDPIIGETLKRTIGIHAKLGKDTSQLLWRVNQITGKESA